MKIRRTKRAPGRVKSGKAWHGAKWCQPSKRWSIYHRDGHACVYCGACANLSLDHIVPEALGGTHDATNLVTSCRPCNTGRGAKSLRAWLRYLRDKGVDTSLMARRIRRLTRRTLDRAEGKRLASVAHAARAERYAA